MNVMINGKQYQDLYGKGYQDYVQNKYSYQKFQQKVQINSSELTITFSALSDGSNLKTYLAELFLGVQFQCKQQFCDSCVNDYNTCETCFQKYYFNGSQCSPCDSSCLTCSGSQPNNCLTCQTPLIYKLSTKTCASKCDQNEFINSSNQCQLCDSSCASCKESGPDKCLTCNQNMFLFNGYCAELCPNGYQSNTKLLTCNSCNIKTSPDCNSCYPTCQLCNKDSAQDKKCITCYTETMRLDVNQNCVCLNPKDIRNIFYQCSYQNIAVLDAYLSESTPQLTIDFGSSLQDIPSNIFQPQSLCQYLFDQTTIDIIGSDSQCQISQNLIEVFLGNSATIMENDAISFLPNKLKFQDYNTYFIDTFYRNIVSQKPPKQAQLQFEYNQIENTCNPIKITLSSIQNDAGRKFAKVNWTLIQITGQISNQQQQNIVQILQQANSNNSTSLIIDPEYLPPNIKIQIQFSYQLKVNQTGFQTFSIFYQQQKIIQINYQQSVYPPIYRYMSFNLYFNFYVQICSLGQTIQSLEPLDLSLVSNQLTEQNISQYNQSNYEYDILPYTLTSNQAFKVTFTLKLSSDNKVFSVKEVSVDVLVSNLYLQIVGGTSFIVNYQNQFVLKSDFRDYEIEDPNLPQNINFSWQCLNVSSIDPTCYDYGNNKIQIEQGKSSISFAAKIFQPYTVIQTTVFGEKDIRKSSSTAICFFSELDIPPLLVQYAASLTQKINLNEDLNFVIVYGGNVSSDTLSYAGAIIYENKVVGVIQFDFYVVRFRIWNYFKDINPSQPKIQIRFSAYNPEFVMPSLTTLSFYLNIPPQKCTLVINPQIGVALQTVFSIQYLNCADDDLPLTYQFFYYNSIDDYNSELISPWKILRRQIKDQTTYNQVKTVLPQGNLVILSQVMDSQLGITNTTQTIQVDAQNKQFDEYYELVNQQIQQIQQNYKSITDQLVALSIVGEDISKNTQLQLSQKMNELQAILVTSIQKLSVQLPKFSLLSTFANKVIAQVQQTIYTSQYQSQSTLKNQTFDYLKTIIQNTQLSIKNNNQSALQQNNDIQMQNTFDSFKVLNSSVSQSTKNSQSDFQNYENISNQIGILLSNLSLPNQGEKYLIGNFSSILSDKITQKSIEKYALPFGEQNSENNTQIYSISTNKYYENIYENTPDFQNYVNKYKNVSQNFTYSKNKLISTFIYNSDYSGLHNELNILYQFDSAVSSQIYKMACVQKNDDDWSQNECSIYKNNQNSKMCLCNQQKPTTILEDIDDMLLKNKNLQTAFGEQGITNFSNFKNFYMYVAFWMLFIITAIQICLFFIGKRLDRISCSQRYQKIHQNQQNNQNNQQSQQQEQQQQQQQNIKKQQVVSNQEQQDFQSLQQIQQKQQNEIVQQDEQSNVGQQSNENELKNIKNLRFQKTFLENGFKLLQFIPLNKPHLSINNIESQDQQGKDIQKSIQETHQEEGFSSKGILTINKQTQSQIQQGQVEKKIQSSLLKIESRPYIATSQQFVELPLTDLIENQEKQNLSCKSIFQEQLPVKNQYDEQKSEQKEGNMKVLSTETQRNSLNKVTGEQNKQNLKLIYKQISKFKRIAIFHQLFAIFYLYDDMISRPVRFTIFYIKIIHTLSISILFAGYNMLDQQIVIAIINSVILKVATLIILLTLKKGKWLKNLSYFFQILISLFYLYVILSVTSGKTPSESNQFIFLFLVSIAVELILVEFIISFVKAVLVHKYFLIDNDKSIYYKLFNVLDAKKILESTDLLID
ncbi:REJ domain protein (macronuclear) [Tetrahymena thermophila SB210]|uniref:REJ domain protein n=1 Tax=Tetrahymena thermophila (strain SB210) TaxID=312017 RepID=Q22YB4_TETTS|nr:REJ domain protein [Tetrahymena thermophila SB210]EAR90272.3 REJ domain protein [Tetrahymena thermophila SB210]|eukprot:XP_001010517.3 REJ domain protein [Tetrahymena thermophila SB210]